MPYQMNDTPCIVHSRHCLSTNYISYNCCSEIQFSTPRHSPFIEEPVNKLVI